MRFSFCLFTALASGALALVSSSCATSSQATAKKREPVLYQWRDDGGPGSVSIRISLSDQIAEYERDGRPIGWSYVATGKQGFSTPTGSFKITEKIVDKYSNKYGWFEDQFGNVVDGDAKSSEKVPEGLTYVAAPMPYWMRLTNYGIGMHGGIIPQPGLPASHGCIRLPKPFVPVLFDAVSEGGSVTITNEPATQGPMTGPSYPPTAPTAGQPLESPRAVPGAGQPAPAYGGDGRVISSRPLTEDDVRRMRTSNGPRMSNPAGY